MLLPDHQKSIQLPATDYNVGCDACSLKTSSSQHSCILQGSGQFVKPLCMTHIALLLKHTKAFPVADRYLNITPNEAGQHGQTEGTLQRDAVIYSVKNQDTGLSDMGVTAKPWGFSWIFSEEKGGDLQSEVRMGSEGQYCGFLGKPRPACPCLSHALTAGPE